MSRYAEASLKITLQTQEYKAKLREMGSLTDKELERETEKYRKELKKREQAEAKSESAILAEKQRAERAASKLRTDAARQELALLARRQEAEAAAAAVTGKASKQIDAVAKSMRLAVPQAGALGEKFGGVARVLDEGFSPALVVATGAIGAVVGVVYKLGSMALDTAANIDEIKKSLGSVSAGSELSGAIHQAETFNKLTKDLNDHWTELSTILSGRVLANLAPIVTTIDHAVQAMSWLLDKQGYANREAQKAVGGVDPNDPSTWTDPGYTAISDANAANINKPADAPAPAPTPTGRSRSTRSSSGPTALPDLVGQGVRDIFADLEEQYQQLADASAKAAVDAANAVQTMNDAAMDADRARIKAEEEEHKKAVAKWIELEQMKAAASESVIGSVADAVSAIGDLWAQSTEDAAEAARRQAVIARTLAVFQLAQDLAKAIGAAIPWAAATGPGAVAAVPAIIGSMTAVFADIASMLAPVPKFHTGGYVMPDETPAKLKRGEVVVDAPRVQAAGGADGVRKALDGGGGNITVLVDLGDRVIETIARKIERRYRGPIRAWGSA